MVSDVEKGWNWVLYTLCEHFGSFRPLNVSRFTADLGIMFIDDERAIRSMI